MNKEAKIAALGKAISRTAGGSMIGASIGMSKGLDATKNNPNASDSMQEANMIGGTLAGAAGGAVVAGPGASVAKKGIGKAVKGIKRIAKIADMEVPTEDEKKKVCNQTSDEEKKEKIENYKEQIEKEAGINVDSQNNNVYLDGDDYADLLDVNPSLESDEMINIWDGAVSEVDTYLNNHHKKNELIDESAFNEKRRSVSSDEADKAFKKSLLKSSLVGGALGATPHLLSSKSSGSAKAIKSLKGGLSGAALGLPVGIVSGSAVHNMKNEEARSKQFGPSRYKVHDEIINDTMDAFKDKKYGYKDAIKEQIEKEAGAEHGFYA